MRTVVVPVVVGGFAVVSTHFKHHTMCKSRRAYYEQTTLTSILRALMFLKIQYIIYMYKGYILHQKVN